MQAKLLQTEEVETKNVGDCNAVVAVSSGGRESVRRGGTECGGGRIGGWTASVWWVSRRPLEGLWVKE
jgi:hypothetical protein